MNKRHLLAVPAAAVLAVILAGPAAAAPNPSERALDNPHSRGCAAVIAHNPNTDPEQSRQAPQGLANFFAVGDTFCF